VNRVARAAVMLAAGLAIAACRQGDYALDDDELRALYSNRIVEGRHRLKGYRFRSFYAANGEFFSYRTGVREMLKGEWWAEDDEVCIRWKSTGDVYCRAVLRDGQGRYRKILVRESGEEVDIVDYTAFGAGTLADLFAGPDSSANRPFR